MRYECCEVDSLGFEVRKVPFVTSLGTPEGRVFGATM